MPPPTTAIFLYRLSRSAVSKPLPMGPVSWKLSPGIRAVSFRVPSPTTAYRNSTVWVSASHLWTLMGRERKGASSAPHARRVKNCPAWGMCSRSGQRTVSRRMSSAMTSWRRTVASQQAARMGNGLLHVHTLVVSGLVEGHARLLLVGQQDAAAGVDHAAVALAQILGDVLGFARPMEE